MTTTQTIPNPLFERILVVIFLSAPPLGGLIVLANAVHNATVFWATVGCIAYIATAISLHIKFVRPYFRRFPWVASYREIRNRSQHLKKRHPKLVLKALLNRVYRSAYRIGFAILLLPAFVMLYDMHRAHFVWFFVGYAICGFGITVGYHRVGTHPSFKTSPVVRGLLLAMGICAMQGPPGEWMKKHSKHHAFGETSSDVHSPYVFDDTKRGIFIEQFKSFMHSFMMWAMVEKSLVKPRGLTTEAWEAKLLANPPATETFRFREDDRHYWEVRDKSGLVIVTTETLIKRRWSKLVDQVVRIERDPVVKFLSNPLVYMGIVAASFVVPYLISGISVWETLARICFVNWVTFCVNSVCHLWGEQPFSTPDNSRNNAFIEILALGEGGHNTHHKSELWAQHGVFGWQFDAAAWVIKGLRAVGLARDLNMPTKQQIVGAWVQWRRREPNMQGYPVRST